VNLLLGLPLIAVVSGVLMPLLWLDGSTAYLRLLWENPLLVAVLAANLGVPSYWLGRRLSQALLLRSTGAKLKAAHEPP